MQAELTAPAAGWSSKAGNWFAEATVSVSAVDSAAGVGGAAISAVWSDGANGSASCTTKEPGACVLRRGNIRSSAASVTLNVTNVVAEGYYLEDPAPSVVIQKPVSQP